MIKKVSIDISHPSISREWHPTKNGDLLPDNFTFGSDKKIWWKCDVANDHIWLAQIKNRTRLKGGGCPMCSGRIVVKSNSLETLYPLIAKQWHYKKNKPLKPNEVTSHSGKSVWWICDKEKSHIWKTSISNRTFGYGCKYCSGQAVNKTNSLKDINVNLAKEWHYELNAPLSPNQVTANSNKYAWWICKRNNKHIWRSKIAHRNKGSGCPFCKTGAKSLRELKILFELKSIFKNINPKGHSILVKSKILQCDIYIDSLELIIEYDGSYWHKNKTSVDRKKTSVLLQEGYRVLRLRERPLAKISKYDISVGNDTNIKSITDKILLFIIKNFNLKREKRFQCEEYIKQKAVVNDKNFNDFINSSDNFIDDNQWYIKYEIFKNFIEENDGRFPTLFEKTSTGFKIGVWLRNQRQAKSAGNLTESRKKYMQDIDIDWQYPKALDFNFKLNLLKYYVSKNQGLPARGVLISGSDIRRWFDRFLKKYKDNDISNSPLSRHHIFESFKNFLEILKVI